MKFNKVGECHMLEVFKTWKFAILFISIALITLNITNYGLNLQSLLLSISAFLIFIFLILLAKSIQLKIYQPSQFEGVKNSMPIWSGVFYSTGCFIFLLERIMFSNIKIEFYALLVMTPVSFMFGYFFNIIAVKVFSIMRFLR